MFDPLIARIIYRRRVFGVIITFRWTMKSSNWQRFVWPIPLRLGADDNE